MAKRLKKVTEEQFNEIQKREWSPLRLEGDYIPDFLKNIPAEVIHSVVASGTLQKGVSYSDKIIPAGTLMTLLIY